MRHKQAPGRVEIKSEEQGTVRAVFATLNVVDLDGDVTLPGAFRDSQEVRISAYNHTSWRDALPVGKGTIREVGNEAILEGRFFLATTAGRDTFEVVKEIGDLQEWSYGFDIIDAERGTFDGQDVQFLRSLDVHEVSPVLLGAGVDTRTLAVKGRDQGTAREHRHAVASLARANLYVEAWNRSPSADARRQLDAHLAQQSA